MKKLFAIMLLLAFLLTSCENFGVSNNDNLCAGTEISSAAEIEMKLTNGLVLTSKYPHAIKSERNTSTKLDYILPIKGGSEEEIKSAMSYEANITVSGTTYNYRLLEKQKWEETPRFSGIVDNKEKFKSLYESLTDENYSDRFSDEFFEDNIVFFMRSSLGFEVCFVGFEYGFDSESKTLKIIFETRPHEGWADSLLEVVGSVMYIIPIAKSDITIDGKLVPYDELKVEVSGKLTVE